MLAAEGEVGRGRRREAGEATALLRGRLDVGGEQVERLLEEGDQQRLAAVEVAVERPGGEVGAARDVAQGQRVGVGALEQGLPRRGDDALRDGAAAASATVTVAAAAIPPVDAGHRATSSVTAVPSFWLLRLGRACLVPGSARCAQHTGRDESSLSHEAARASGRALLHLLIVNDCSHSKHMFTHCQGSCCCGVETARLNATATSAGRFIVGRPFASQLIGGSDAAQPVLRSRDCRTERRGGGHWALPWSAVVGCEPNGLIRIQAACPGRWLRPTRPCRAGCAAAGRRRRRRRRARRSVRGSRRPRHTRTS